MPRKKKDSKPFNIRMERSVYDKLVEFCKESGQSKTIAVECAVQMYIEQNKQQNV